MNGFGVDADALLDLPGTALDLAFNQNIGMGLTYMRMGMGPGGSPQGPGGLDGPWTHPHTPTYTPLTNMGAGRHRLRAI